MSQTLATAEAALACIASARLTPTEHLLLKDLVESAVDSNRVAEHILRRIEKNPNKTTEENLRFLKEDWRKLTSKCKPSSQPTPFDSGLLKKVFVFSLSGSNIGC